VARRFGVAHLRVQGKRAAGQQNSARRGAREQQLADIAAGIETRFFGEAVHLREFPLFDEFPVEIRGLDLVHVRAGQGLGAGRHHADQDVVDTRLRQSHCREK
jgi:hypothetical protein